MESISSFFSKGTDRIQVSSAQKISSFVGVSGPGFGSEKHWQMGIFSESKANNGFMFFCVLCIIPQGA